MTLADNYALLQNILSRDMQSMEGVAPEGEQLMIRATHKSINRVSGSSK